VASHTSSNIISHCTRRRGCAAHYAIILSSVANSRSKRRKSRDDIDESSDNDEPAEILISSDSDQPDDGQRKRKPFGREGGPARMKQLDEVIVHPPQRADSKSTDGVVQLSNMEPAYASLPLR
jgi:hypothetical protein